MCTIFECLRVLGYCAASYFPSYPAARMLRIAATPYPFRRRDVNAQMMQTGLDLIFALPYLIIIAALVGGFILGAAPIIMMAVANDLWDWAHRRYRAWRYPNDDADYAG